MTIVLILWCAFPALGEDPPPGEELDEELSTLEDDDFPDLVSVSESGGIMDEFAFLEDAGMVESAARHRQKIGMSPSAIWVITREDIETSGASTIPDLLRLVPGMEAIIVSPFLTANTARLYWTYENNNFLVLIDGREANLELLGQPFWEAQPISPDDIERIEVIRGPGSSLYGANAFAGVITITTRVVPDKTSASVRFSSGEMGATTIGARATSRLGDFGISLSGGADWMGNFNDHRHQAKRVWKMSSMVEYHIAEDEKVTVEGFLSRGIGPLFAGAGTIETDGTFRSVRLAYQSEKLRGQFYWFYATVLGDLRESLNYAGIFLADFEAVAVDGHTLDGEVQWTVPDFWEPLMIIVGAGGRGSRASDASLLDVETYSDPQSSHYHEPGLVHWEGRGGAFVHGELAVAVWLTITGGLRMDYNTETGEFLSPRLAAIFKPGDGQYLRLGAARAFRKPSFLEDVLHPNVSFPPESPIQGDSAQNLFREFMTRTIGGENLKNEQLWAFEAGYRGELLDRQLIVTLDLFCNLYLDATRLESNLIEDERGLPDLRQSSFQFDHQQPDTRFIGGELALRFNPNRSVSLLFSWAYREGFEIESGRSSNESPKHLLTAGGRFKTDGGLLGSLYLFSRSRFFESDVPNPGGILEPYLTHEFDDVFLLIGRLGWRVALPGGVGLETGLKLFLPVSPFSKPHFGYYEMGGGVTPFGAAYGGQLLRRYLQVYLQGQY